MQEMKSILLLAITIVILSCSKNINEEVDLELLKNIADKTKGGFYHARHTGELGYIFDEIDKIEKHKIETLEFTRFRNIGFKYAIVGVVILLIGLQLLEIPLRHHNLIVVLEYKRVMIIS